MNQKLKMTMSVILGFSTSIRKLTGNVKKENLDFFFFDDDNLKISLKITFHVCVCVCFCGETAYKSFHPICLLPKKNLYLCVRL